MQAPPGTTVNNFVDWSQQFHTPPWQVNNFLSIEPEVPTVFDVLNLSAVTPSLDVTSVGDGAGLYVTGLSGVEQDQNTGYYWIYLVDGKEPTVGCDSYVLHGGESIVWDYKHFSSGLKQATHPGF